MKRKENGENICKMLNAGFRNSKSILAFMKKEIKDTKRETGRKMLGEQFSKVFLRTIRDQAILWKVVHVSSLLSLKRLIIQITWNSILYHWNASPAINYGKLLVLFFFLNISRAQVLFLFLLIWSWWYFKRKQEDSNSNSHMLNSF